MHDGHDLIEAVAAAVLSLGGAVIVARAWLDRQVGHAPPDWKPLGTDHVPSDVDVRLVALLSASSAAIHLAAAPAHVEALGDLGLGFYWAALLQGGFAVAWIVTARSRDLARAAIVINGVLIGVWVWSRTVGMPVIGTAEPIGTADAAAVFLETGLIALLAGPALGWRRPEAALARLPGTAALVAVAGVAVLATAIALVDLGAGGHGGAHGSVAVHIAGH